MGTMILGPILAQNAFIGLLCNCYEDAQRRINEHFAKFRVMTLKLYIQRKLFWANVLGFASRESLWKGGYWIRIPDYLLSADDEDDDATINKMEKVKEDIKGELAEIMTAIKNLNPEKKDEM